MKRFLYIALILTLHLSFSQNNESIKKADTLYLHFDKASKNNFKTIDNQNKTNQYRFELNDRYFLTFYYRNILNFDDYFNNKLADVKILNNEFLKVQKDVILTSEFLKENAGNSEKEIFNWIYKNIRNKNKIYYVIDSEEFESNNITLRQINPFQESYEPPDVIPVKIKLVNIDTISQRHFEKVEFSMESHANQLKYDIIIYSNKIAIFNAISGNYQIEFNGGIAPYGTDSNGVNIRDSEVKGISYTVLRNEAFVKLKQLLESIREEIKVGLFNKNVLHASTWKLSILYTNGEKETLEVIGFSENENLKNLYKFYKNLRFNQDWN